MRNSTSKIDAIINISLELKNLRNKETEILSSLKSLINDSSFENVSFSETIETNKNKTNYDIPVVKIVPEKTNNIPQEYIEEKKNHSNLLEPTDKEISDNFINYLNSRKSRYFSAESICKNAKY